MLDELGQQIMQELQEDARQSFRHIGRKLGVAEGTIRNRVRNLLKKKAMKLQAVPDPQKFGFEFVCITGLEVKLSERQEVYKVLAKSPNVYYLAGCTGYFDMIAILLFRKAQELDDFVKDTIANIPGVIKTQTFVNMHIAKSPWIDSLDLAALLKS